MKLFHYIAAGLALTLSQNIFAAESTGYINPTVLHGSKVFNQRCTMCHGNVGMGDGLLPRMIKTYPNTNLRTNTIGTNPQSIREAIIYGGERGNINELMPPFGDELTWLEIESLVLFMRLYYKDADDALALLSKTRVVETANRKKGQAIYKGRCILCHGIDGDGKGKMAKIIKNPPPFNLKMSRVPDAYLLDIISKGGEAMGRSPKMPIFGEELNKSDIGHIISYIKTFRE